jgi:site-specific DNA-methyltransferase (adenine-specific)
MIDYIKCGDCAELMKELPECFVDLTVTSPPYDNLRTYNGFEWCFEDTAKELFRITKTGGVVVWIVNDATIKGDETGSSFKQALFFKECGFNLHDTMIWIKDGGGAVGSNKCYTQNFEYMFVLSKGTPKTINLIRDKINLSFGVDKSGVGRRKPDGTKKIEQRKPAKEFSKRNNWWYIPPQKGKEHPAVFPEQLANDHILTWSNEGDVVFDPFLGSGTTAKMAILNNRHYVGFELSDKYYQLALERIEKVKKQVENKGWQSNK